MAADIAGRPTSGSRPRRPPETASGCPLPAEPGPGPRGTGKAGSGVPPPGDKAGPTVSVATAFPWRPGHPRHAEARRHVGSGRRRPAMLGAAMSRPGAGGPAAMSAALSGGGGGMVAVLPGLYVGGVESCSSPESLAAAKVVAVLTVDAEEAPVVPGVRAMHVRALDEPGADLLSHLDDCAAFIGAARAGGGAALVRCQAGVSRSVAVVTAYLMKTEGLGWEQAYAAVRAAKPDAEVNPGFQEQLKLYEAMGCAVDSSSALYKRYRLQMLTEKYPELQDLPREVFAVDPTNICQTPNTEVLYRCRKCRRALFRSSSVLSHAEGSGPAAFAHKRAAGSAQLCGDGRDKCTSYFTEPVQWMEPALLGVMEGQLLCPKCTSKLGSFSWRGDQCSCGRWVTPAFQIHKSRVDEVRTLPAGNFQTAKT